MDGMPSWWALDIQEHDFRIVHHKGSQNANADALSQIQTSPCPAAIAQLRDSIYGLLAWTRLKSLPFSVVPTVVGST